MEEKAEQVIKRRKWEYIRDSLIAIAVIAVLVTGIVLAVKFLKGEPDSIVLYDENGEAIGKFTENAQLDIPTKKGYSSTWLAESGQSYDSIEAALASGEASVKQVFSPIQYTLTLYLTGGQFVEDVGYERHDAVEGQEDLGAYYTRTYTIEDEIFDLPAISNASLAAKRGSTFGFWSNVNYVGKNYTADNLKSTEIKNIETSNARDVVLYAVWKDIICTVNVYKHTGGLMFFEAHKQTSILSEDAILEKVMASAPAGYDFVGLYADQSYSTPFDFTQEIMDKIVHIYTKWKAQTFKLEFRDIDDSLLLSTTYETDAEINFYDYPDIPGKTFDGWLLDNVLFESEKMPPKDIVLKASLTNIPYTIKWVVDDNRQATETYYYGDEPQAPSTLNTDKAEDEGYTYVFDGWSPALQSVTEDATYEAQYRAVIKQYTYSFEVDGVELGTPTTVDYDTDIVFPTSPASYEKDGYYYTFSKWVIEGTDVTPTKVTKDMTITAKFSKQICSYTISWLDKDGNTIQVRDNNNNLVDSLTFDYGTVVDLSIGYSDSIASYTKEVDGHTRTYTFVGWVIGGITHTSDYTIAGNTIARAKYENNDPKFKYKLFLENGDFYAEENFYVAEANELYNAIKDIERTKAADNKFTYTFDGWYFDNNGIQTKLTADTVLTVSEGDIIELTEKFEEHYIDYTITWVLNNEQGNVEATYHYGDVLNPNADLTAASKTTTKEPTISTVYTFSGWKNYTENDTVTKSTSYLAQYTESTRQYTYTFIVDGETVKTSTIDYNTQIVAPVNPTKAADAQYTYTFDDWYKDLADDTTVFVNGTKIAGDVTYYANFDKTVNQYTYTFLMDDGETVIESATEDYGFVVTKPADPSKDETVQYTYTFDHWETLDGEAYVDYQELHGDVTYIAVFSATTRKYTYTFYNGNVAHESDLLEYGTSLVISTITEPTKADDENMYTYTFNGWYDNSSCTGDPISDTSITIEGAIEFFAGYTKTPINHTYTFKKFSTDEDAYATVTVGYGEDVTAPQNPTRDYYTFAGWDKPVPSTMGTADDIFVATWTPIEYTITYELNNGTNNANNPATYTVESADIELEDPTRLGYEFAGWSNEGKIASGSHGNKTFTASWNVINYNITYVLNDGTNNANNPATYTVEDAITLANPTRLGYDFVGWDNGGTIAKGSTGAKTFTASWEIIEYDITYVLNGGSATTNIAKYTIETPDADLVLKVAADSTKTGYTLTGWEYDNTAITSIKDVRDTMGVLDDITIYAVFEANKYTITYDIVKTGATVTPASKEVTYDSQYGSLPTPVLLGYDFAGWYLDSNYTEQSKIINSTPVTITANSTVYAKWTLHTYHVHGHVANGETVDFTFDVENPVTLTAYTNNGEFVFGNWYEEDVNDASIDVADFTVRTTFGASDITVDTADVIDIYAIVKPADLTISGSTVTAYTGTATHVIIPRVWNGLEITTIADNTFKKNSTITTVDTAFITTIGNQAFYRCTSLVNVDLSSATTIGDQAFINCKALTSVDLSSATAIGEDAFSNSGLTEITLSKNLASLGDYAFFDCEITTIHFNGTRSEFEAIINASEGNEHLLNV